MRGTNCLRQSIVCHLRDLVDFFLCERGVGCDNGYGGIAEGIVFVRRIGQWGLWICCKWVTWCGDELSVLWVNDVTKGVDGDDCADKCAIAKLCACRAEAALDGERGGERFGDGCACSRAYRSLCDSIARRVLTGPIA